MPAPEFAGAHAAARIAIGKAVTQVAREQWSKVDRGDIGKSWLTLLPRLLLALITGQRLAASGAESYAAEAAASAGLADLAMGTIQAAGFAGAAADGRSLLSLLFQPVINTLDAIGKGAKPDDAMALGAAKLEMITRSEIADAGRTADQVAMTARPNVDGYIRVVIGDTCSRCIILAGRWYPISEWFERHPLCDCVMLPAKQAESAGLVQDPVAIYDGLTTKQRTEAGWNKAEQEAIDEGADINQVTNARRGVYTAGGRQYTTEGTTRSGLFGGYDVDPETGKLKRRPKGAKRKPRLTPEQIYSDARDRDEAIRLLQENGYLLAPARAGEQPKAPEPDRIQIARDRQAAIDAARNRAEILAEAEHLILDDIDAEPEVIRHRLAATAKRLDLANDPAISKLLKADADDREALAAAIRTAADDLGLIRIGGRDVVVNTGDGELRVQRMGFDRDLHKMTGGEPAPAQGATVDLVRPGYQFDHNGETILLRKAEVEESVHPEVKLDKPDPAQARRDQQQKNDVLISKAKNVAELWEMLLNDSEPDSIRRRMNQMKLGDDPAMAALLQADLEGRDSFRIALGDAAARLGLEPISGDRIVRIRNRFGEFDIERTTFDRTRHKLLADAGKTPEGSHVDIVKPGFFADINGKKTRLMHAAVMTASDEEIVSERPMPVGGMAESAVKPEVRAEGQDLSEFWRGGKGPTLERLIEERARYETAETYGDHVLGEIVHHQTGFGKAAVIVSPQQLDAAIAAGWRQLWRGQSDSFFDEKPALQVTEAARTGPWLLGEGNYGNGFYASERRATAEEYRQGWINRDDNKWGPAPLYEWQGEFHEGNRGGMLRMALDPSAKVGEWTEMQAGHDRYIALVRRESSAEAADIVSDFGRYAALLGYDAVFVPGGEGFNDGGLYPPGVSDKDEPGQWIIFNRSALLMEEASDRYDT